MKRFFIRIVRRRVKRGIFARLGRRNYLKHKEEARALIMRRLEHFQKLYGFEFKKVAIRNQKTRWGSCSKKGNLNFNYKLVLLPEHLADYVIFHELCHLKEFNHSPKFWALVAKAMPDYLERKRELAEAVFVVK